MPELLARLVGSVGMAGVRNGRAGGAAPAGPLGREGPVTAMALQDRPAGTGPAVDLRCATAVSEDGQGLVIGLAGELDLAGADALVALVGLLCTDGQRRLVVDLAGLEFVDVAGLQALRSAHRAAAGYGTRLTFTGARPPARRLLALTGFAAELGLR